jgi:guanine nucleotide-binding protein subunit alpha-12
MNICAEKIRRINVSEYLPDFHGDNRSLKEVQLFLLGLFESARRQRSRPFFYHFTTAIDTQNIRRVFDDCKDIILERAVKDII